MSGQAFSDDFDRASLGFPRSDSVLSARSEQSNHDDDVTQTQNESIDMLAGEEAGANQNDLGNQQMMPGLINEELLRKAFKRAIEPLMFEVKKVKKENGVLDKKLSQVLAQNETLQKLVKELKAEMSKGVEDLSLLLTGDGVQFLKQICLGNLDMRAKEETESALVQKFIDKARQEGWLIKRSQKSEKDIISKYRDNRNYLKAQIRLRVSEDFSNQTPLSSSKLPKTLKFIREHLSTPELSNENLLVLYNYAYTVLKYNNKGIEEETMTEAEKKIKEKARKNIWVYAMERVESDRKAKKDASAVRDKIFRILQTGVKYDPY